MQKETFNEFIASPGWVLVDFFATWCGPCKQMHPVLEQLKSEMGDKLRIGKIDVDQEEALAASYNIQTVPTLILYKDGVQRWRKSGYQSPGALKAAIEAEV